MSINVKTSWVVLMAKAKAVGNAVKSGDAEALKRAEEELRAYERIVLESDGMIIGPRRDLD